MRLWPKTWFHTHEWKKLVDMTPIRFSDLDGAPDICIGVQCQVSWCKKLDWISPRGSWSHTHSPSEERTYEDAMEMLRREAEDFEAQAAQ